MLKGLAITMWGLVVGLVLAAGAHAATWKLTTVPLPTGGTEGEARAISCFSSTNCTAVGDYWNGSIWGAAGDEWNGTAWSIASVIANPGEKNGDLVGVSCYSATSCRAVGAYGTSAKIGATLVEGKKEKVWKQIPSPNSALGKNDELRGVSCPEGEFCLATGQFLRTFGEESGAILATEWQGEEWVLLSPIENPGGQKNGQLSGTSCIEAGVCVSAGGWGEEFLGEGLGRAGSESYSRAEKKWVATRAQEPATAKFAAFYGISCKSTTFCLAVGKWSENKSSAPYRALADTWNGSKWTLVLSSGGPPGATESALNGVSCTSTEECEVVGSARNSSGAEVTLAYLWKSGKWELQSTPNPTGATASFLTAISCTAAEVCSAVGAERNGSNQLKPFGEGL